MPRRFERHKRSQGAWDNYDAPGSRSAEVRDATRADPEPPKRAPARKNTRDWCRGREGVPHEPVIVAASGPSGPGCLWWPDWRDTVRWLCRHREECANCAKILRPERSLRAAECPAYPGTPEQRAAAVADLAASLARQAAWPWRKPPITGPQGYRRKRPAS